MTFHRKSSRQILVLCLAWVLIAFVKPELKLFKLWEQIRRLWKGKDIPLVIGDIAAYQSPGMILIRQKGTGRVKFGTPLILKDENAPVKAGVSLDYIGRDEGLLLRAIEFEITSEHEKPIVETFEFLPQNSVAQFQPGTISLEKLPFLEKFNEFVGIVAPETSIDRLYFEVIREKDLEEGRLIEVAIREVAVMYQVIDGLTREEIIHQKNTFGYARAKAKKIGMWSNEKKKFFPVKWLPRPNEPVYLKTTEEYVLVKEAVGHFPGANYSVAIKNVHDLVTHNTAILGILGVGKSMLAIELCERMMTENIKVVCVDFTRVQNSY